MTNRNPNARPDRPARQLSSFSQLTAEAQQARRIAYEAALAVIG